MELSHARISFCRTSRKTRTQSRLQSAGLPAGRAGQRTARQRAAITACQRWPFAAAWPSLSPATTGLFTARRTPAGHALQAKPWRGLHRCQRQWCRLVANNTCCVQRPPRWSCENERKGPTIKRSKFVRSSLESYTCLYGARSTLRMKFAAQ